MNRKKIIIILVTLIILLFGGLSFLSMAKSDENAIAEHSNSTYSDYVENPDNYTVLNAKIVDEHNSDVGDEINFFESREWIVEVEKTDGTVMQTTVLRAKDDKLGDVIKIACEKDNSTDATQLYYIECDGVRKSLELLTAIDVSLIVLAIGGIFYFIFKK